MKKSLKLLLENLWIKYNYKLLLTVSLIILTSFTEGLSVIFLIPLFNKLGFENAITSDLLNNLFKFIERYIEFDWVGILSIIFILCFTQLLMIILSGWMLSKVSQDYLAYWKKKLFSKILNSNLNFINIQKSGEITSIIINETNRLHSATMNLLTLISTIVTTFIYLIYCFAISPSLSLLIIITGIILASFLSLLYKITKAIGIKIGPLLSKQQVFCQKPLTVFKL